MYLLSYRSAAFSLQAVNVYFCLYLLSYRSAAYSLQAVNVYFCLYLLSYRSAAYSLQAVNIYFCMCLLSYRSAAYSLQAATYELAGGLPFGRKKRPLLCRFSAIITLCNKHIQRCFSSQAVNVYHCMCLLHRVMVSRIPSTWSPSIPMYVFAAQELRDSLQVVTVYTSVCVCCTG